MFSGPRANYNITTGGGHVTVADTTGTDGVDTLTHIERLRFTRRDHQRAGSAHRTEHRHGSGR